VQKILVSEWSRNASTEKDAYPLQIEAEIVVFVECTGASREILEFSFGNFVYECL